LICLNGKKTKKRSSGWGDKWRRERGIIYRKDYQGGERWRVWGLDYQGGGGSEREGGD